MADDFGTGVIAVVLAALVFAGIWCSVSLVLETRLVNRYWDCTQVVLKDGDPMCINYERVTK